MEIARNIGRRGLFVSFFLSMLVALGPGRSFGATATVSLSPVRGAGASSGLATETASDGRRAYIVVLRDAPLVRSILTSAAGVAKPFRAALPSELDAMTRDLSRKQDAFEADMRGKIAGFQAGTRFRNVLNGMSVLVPEGGLSVLRSDPRVKTVYPVRKYKLHLDTSNPLMNAPAFWGTVGGDANAGAGVKIADVDTGVDFSNPMFSDSSLAMPAGFPKENDGNHFANSKVIVAKYFQGIIDSTSAALNAGHRTAQDLSGHGSHTASVAAGAKVALSGGGRRPVTLEGVAPKAYIGDYRVFAPNAFSDNIIAAIDEAVADGMDVLNMSFGLNDPDTGLEPFLFNNAGEFEAIENAIAGGMVVTISAGNSGVDANGNPLPGSISSSADIPDVIAVGATTNSHNGVSASLLARISLTSGGAPPSVASIIGAQGVGTGVTFPAVPITSKFLDWDNSDGAGDSLGCTKILDPLISGKIVLIQRGTCTFSAKVGNAASAGAIGVVVYNSVAGGDSLLVPSVDGTSIPTIFVTRTDGLNLKAYLDANPGASAPTGSFGPAPSGTPAATFAAASHDLADFSSNGPTIDFQIKPDLTSVGVGSYAACQDDDPLGEGRFPVPDPDSGQDTPIFDPSGFTFGDGTSFSAPRAAGSAALMVQKHPNWSPAEIKAALMETSARPTDPNDASKVGNLSVMRRGSGDIDLAAASAVGAVALPASQSFRQVFLNGAPPAGFLTQTFTLENKSTVPATYQLQAAATSSLSDPAVTPTVSPSTLSLAPATSGTFTLTLNVAGSIAQGQNDSEGAVSISDGGTTISGALYVPYWIRIQNQNGTPPLLETASAKVDSVTASQVNIDLTAHDNEGDIDSFSILFSDSTGQIVAFASDTFNGSLDGQKDVSEELQITGVTPAVCPDCVSATVQLFDSKGFASNVLQARYKPASVRSVPASNGSDFRRVVPLVANTQGAGFFFQSDARIFNPSFSHPVTINAFLVQQGQAASSALGVNHLVQPRESLALNDLCLNDFDSPGIRRIARPRRGRRHVLPRVLAGLHPQRGWDLRHVRPDVDAGGSRRRRRRNRDGERFRDGGGIPHERRRDGGIRADDDGPRRRIRRIRRVGGDFHAHPAPLLESAIQPAHRHGARIHGSGRAARFHRSLGRPRHPVRSDRGRRLGRHSPLGREAPDRIERRHRHHRSRPYPRRVQQLPDVRSLGDEPVHGSANVLRLAPPRFRNRRGVLSRSDHRCARSDARLQGRPAEPLRSDGRFRRRAPHPSDDAREPLRLRPDLDAERRDGRDRHLRVLRHGSESGGRALGRGKEGFHSPRAQLGFPHEFRVHGGFRVARHDPGELLRRERDPAGNAGLFARGELDASDEPERPARRGDLVQRLPRVHGGFRLGPGPRLRRGDRQPHERSDLRAGENE